MRFCRKAGVIWGSTLHCEQGPRLCCRGHSSVLSCTCADSVGGVGKGGMPGVHCSPPVPLPSIIVACKAPHRSWPSRWMPVPSRRWMPRYRVAATATHAHRAAQKGQRTDVVDHDVLVGLARQDVPAGTHTTGLATRVHGGVAGCAPVSASVSCNTIHVHVAPMERRPRNRLPRSGSMPFTLTCFSFQIRDRCQSY